MFCSHLIKHNNIYKLNEIQIIMDSTLLNEILADANSLGEVFAKLKDKNLEVMIIKNLGMTYKPIIIKSDFAIIEDSHSNSKEGYIHPYGTTMGYAIYEPPKKENSTQ
jgi:hypothetical protein